jgi:hypothetical protein
MAPFESNAEGSGIRLKSEGVVSLDRGLVGIARFTDPQSERAEEKPKQSAKGGRRIR